MASINLQSEDDGGDGYTSPELSLGVSSPWIKIVSGESGEVSPPVVSVTSPAEPSSSCSVQEQIVNASTDWYPPETESSPDESGTGCQHEGSNSGGGGSNAVKKPVWSKPSIVVEVVSPVMGAVSWPALGESTKAARKSSSSETLQAVSDESLLPALQVTGNSSPSSHKPASENPTSTPNHVTNSGQRSMRRGGAISGGHSSSNRGLSRQSPESQESKVESPPNSLGKPATVLNSYPKDHTYKESPRGGFGSQPNSGNDHHYQRNSYKRGNGGLHTRGDGSYHHNYGGKPLQGQGRVNQPWNQHRNFNRNTNMQPQRGGYIRPSVHNSISFIHPPMSLAPSFGNNVLYPDVAYGMIYVQGPAPPIVHGPFYYPAPDPLHSKIVSQIDYYFSNDNLVKDTYLRRYMDEQGWVPVNVIARFNKVSSLTNNVQLILDVMQKSTLVEVQGDKMRRRNDWMRWLMPAAVQDSLWSQLQGIRLDEEFSSPSSSGEACSQLQQGGGDLAPRA